MNKVINLCVLDHSSLMQEAKAILEEKGIKDCLFITNERASKYNVRGRSINFVFMYGLERRNIDAILLDAIETAQYAARALDFKCEFVII